tara:strand:- start:1659 stop:2168 length:510 start_codon:yes stop_codon:yes gene_type:complete
MNVWQAPANVIDLLEEIKNEHHSPRLDQATIGVCFADSKAFPNNRLNYGKTSKFTSFARIWQQRKLDFCLTLCADVWHSVLSEDGKRALIDLHLTRCEVEWEPVLDENGKPAKDEWGRVQYTEEIKYNDDGTPKWKVLPLDLTVFADNVRKYGLWCEELDMLGTVVQRE